MYEMKVSLYFAEDEKEHEDYFNGSSVEEVKSKVSPEYVARIGNQYSMLPGEVVISYTISKDGEYIDSEEIFAEYTGREICMFA